MSIQCRTCADNIFNPNAKNIFEQDDNEILLNIETLTGIRLYEERNMPTHICTCCHLELYHSMVFRERCIRTQQFLKNGKPKAKFDPLKAAHKDILVANASANRPLCVKIKDEHISSTSDPTVSNQQYSSQCRLLRGRKQTPENCKDSYDSSPAQAASVEMTQQIPEDMVNLEAADRFNDSPTSSLHNSTSMDELHNAFGEISDFQEEISPASSPMEGSSIAPLSSALNDSVTTNTISSSKKGKKINAKPTADPKVFICDLCGHQSSNQKNLQIHILRHKGEKNFECEECGLKHYSKYLLQLHIRVKHRGEMPFSCRYCEQRFFSGSTRQRHEQ
ncbi:GH22314 [Drosophila grimshawi]|uniref:GH22314 n=2 Tax=Drosophila grimshawi TaxID=7222 RepID=B4JYX3_DROGR|nr:GH22314 [Drosophila grimshawi]